MILNRNEFVVFQKFITDRFGLDFCDTKREKLEYCITERIKQTGASGFREYFFLLQTEDKGAPELKELVKFLTVGETFFFRYKSQFTALKAHLLPALIKEKREKEQLFLRILSAGCSTGEEPYSIALVLSEMRTDLVNWKIDIIGADINEDSIKTAEQGIYGKRAVKDVEHKILSKYFRPENDSFILNREIRKMVQFRYFNLNEDSFRPVTGAGSMDIIFCRNVAIYFNRETAERIYKKFYEGLNDNGYLVLGHSESLGKISESFKSLTINNSFIYQKKPPGKNPDDSFFRKGRPGDFDAKPLRLKSPEEKNVKVRELYKEARKLADLNHYDEALEKCAQLIKIDPVFAPGHFLRGIIRYKQDKIDEAMESFKRAVYSDPELVLARYQLAELYRKKGDNKKAINENTNALRCLEKKLKNDFVELSDGFTNGALQKMCLNNLKTLSSNS